MYKTLGRATKKEEENCSGLVREVMTKWEAMGKVYIVTLAVVDVELSIATNSICLIVNKDFSKNEVYTAGHTQILI